MRLPLYVILTFLLFLCALSGFSQKPVSGVNTILHKIGRMQDDTNKVKAYFLEENRAIYSSENAFKIYPEAWKLANKLDFPNGMVNADLNLANWYNDRANYIKALELVGRAADEAKRSSKIDQLNVLFVSRWIYRGLQNFAKGIEYDNKALKLIRQMDNDTLLCRVYIVLANDYGDLKSNEMSLLYAQKALPIAEKLNNAQIKAIVYSVLGFVYYSMGNQLLAYQYNIKAVKIEGEDDPNSANTLVTLGLIYRNAPDSLLVKMGIRPNQRVQKSLEYFKKSLAAAKKVKVMSMMAENYFHISKSYEDLKDYKEAYQTYQNHILYRDSTTNETQKKIIIQNEARVREQALKYQQQLAEINARQQRNYYAAGILVLVLISFVVSRSYLNQRNSNRLLSAANTQISFEKNRSEDLLLNILPADVAEELKEKGSAHARLFDEVTVIFTDFVNFTIVSELLTPQELVDELNVCFREFDTIMTTHGNEKIKTIGDAYLAVSGLPNAISTHASSAVKAALDIQRFMQDHKLAKGNKTFDIRIGIHSGSVVAGIVGLKKFAYDIWGDTVNTAARMEQNSQPGKINISEKTRELMGDEFLITYRGEIEAKNKGAMKMYFVDGVSPKTEIIEIRPDQNIS